MAMGDGNGNGSSDGGRDILLAGAPRSGATLAARLLSTVPGVVALNEPQVPGLT
ncbi:MAG: hypothetical protein ACKOWF_06075 [Chloroflexota bacterium]